MRQVRDALEILLRDGEAEEVIARLEAALDALDEHGHPIAEVCRAVTLDSIDIIGWQRLTLRISELDACGPRITAIGINISCQGNGFIDEGGEANPYLETAFFSDNAFGFSAASRAALLTGYGEYGNEWQDAFVEIDETLSIAGLSELQTAVFKLESAFRHGLCDNGADHDALFIGSAWLATRIHQAVREAVISRRLPRPLTVLVGSNESSPFFDAPVITANEYREFAPQLENPKSEPEAEAEAEVQVDLAAGGFELDLSQRVSKALVAPPVPLVTSQPAEPATLDADEAPLAGNALRRSMLARSAGSDAALPVPPVAKTASLLDRLFRRK